MPVEAPNEDRQRFIAIAGSFRSHVLVPVAVLLSLFIASRLGIFSATDGMLFDLASGTRSPVAPQVILIEHSDRWTQSDAVRALAAVQPMGMRGAVFMSDPFYGGLRLPVAPTVPVIVGREAHQVPGHTFEWSVAPADNRVPVVMAATAIPPAENGIFRRQLRSLPAPDNGRLATIEGAAVGRDRPAEFLISLPSSQVIARIPAAVLLSGGAPPGLLEGKLLLFGNAPSVDPPRFPTSAAGETRIVSASELHARALESLLGGRAAVGLGAAARGLLAAMFAFAFPFLSAHWSPKASLRNSLLLVLLLLGLTYLVLIVANIMLPVGELAAAQLLLGAAVFYQKEIAQEESLQRLVANATSYVARHTVLREQSRWTHFFTAMTGLVGTSRSIVIKAGDSQGFDIIAAQNERECLPALGSASTQLANADGRRPEPVRAGHLSGWGANSYIARLSPAGATPLYWIFQLDSDDPGVTSSAKRTARRASQMLEAIEDRPSRQGVPGEPLNVAIASSMNMIVERTSVLRRSVSAMETAFMLFDASGLPVETNASMLDLIRHAGLDPQGGTPVEIVSTIIPMSREASERIVGEIVRDGGELRLASTREISGRRYVLRCTHSLEPNGQPTGDLLLEAIDVTDVHRLGELQREIATYLDANIRNNLEAIELAAGLASDDRLEASAQRNWLGHVVEAARRARDRLNSIDRLLYPEMANPMQVPHPVNARALVERALATVRSASGIDDARIEVDLPEVASPVLAEPSLAEQAIGAMLRVAIFDMPEGKNLLVSLKVSRDTSLVEIKGGFGTSPMRLARMLSSDKSKTTNPGHALISKLGTDVETWGGKLSATSREGRGFHFKLNLRNV